MAQLVHARLDAHFAAGDPAAADYARARSQQALLGEISLTVYEDMPAIEREWREFEQRADCTVFQTFDWLASWQRHIGARSGAQPAIVVARAAAGTILLIVPLSIRSAGFARELTWLGADLCDYNAPLLAPTFRETIDRAGFMALWERLTQCLQNHPRLQFDYIHLTKMPEMVAAQPNPMRHLRVTKNPSGAYLTHLAGDWDTFYTAKRSSATRRRDRTKRKRLSDFGEVRLFNPTGDDDIVRTLDTLIEQKTRSFASMGVANLFARPGYADFYRALATDPATKTLVHLSTLNVGAAAAAANLGLTYGGCYYHILASYDDGEMARFGPGAAHLHDLLHLAIDRGFRIFDFTIGDERYKRDWCDTEIKLYDFVSAATWRGALVAMPMVVTQRLKRWIKQTPILWNAFSAARRLIAPLTHR
jgi:CelD/BcsL family acetyltransferase involved in cellulose biosynthesis